MRFSNFNACYVLMPPLSFFKRICAITIIHAFLRDFKVNEILTSHS
jgi:hypothetical protein